MIRNCEICNSNKKKILYEQNFYNQTISPMEKYDVCICKECGFIYADNIPSQEKFDKYYGEISRYEFQHNDGIVSKSYIKHTEKLADFIDSETCGHGASILDIGCSTGTLLSILKKRGYHNLTGIDPSPSCIKTINKKYNIDAYSSTISNFKLHKTFDIIILSAVLEHIVDLNHSLQIVSNLLKEDGVLIIEIPDAGRFKDFIYTPYQQFSIEHIRYFTEISIRNLLLKNNFDIYRLEYNINEGNQTVDPNFFIFVSKIQNNNKIIKDKKGKKCIKKYISKCKKLDKKINKKIKKKLKNESEIIVWGVGTNTQRLLNNGLDLSKVRYFVDSNVNYKGKKLLEKFIEPPNMIWEDWPILIMSWSYQEEIIKQIEDLGLKNKIITIY